ncbi:MAG: hypothetical protein JWM11_3557 [Planctomycetaceae bacterium]|nr:hypothetical protein [Planctomycetaceae bacterium]
MHFASKLAREAPAASADPLMQSGAVQLIWLYFNVLANWNRFKTCPSGLYQVVHDPAG